MQRRNRQTHLSTRIGKLETSVSHIDTKVDGLEANMGAMARALERLSEKISAANQPQWGVIASFSGVLITLIALIGGAAVTFTSLQIQGESRLVDAKISTVKKSIADNAANLSSRAGKRWNRPDQERFEDHLFRELDLLIKHDEESLSDRRNIAERLKAIEAIVNNIKEEQTRRTKEVYKK